MQANTKDRMLNMQTFAGLLRCIRNICTGRFIEHLAVVDIEGASQDWYRDFFRLAGFHQCHCQDSAGGAQQLETRRCLALRKAQPEDFPNVYETIRIWLAEGRCTRVLLDSVAFGNAAEVERRYFRRLLAELENRESAQRTQTATSCVGRIQMQSRRPWQESEKTWAIARKKGLKLGNEAQLSRKHWSSEYAVVKKECGSAVKAWKKRRWSQKTQRGLSRANKSQTRQYWQEE